MPTYRALVARGLERAAAKELRALGGGVGKTRPGKGFVVFEGPPDAHLRANLRLRIVERILLRAGEVEARFEQELVDALSAVEWERWIRPGAEVKVVSSTRRCRIFHTGLLDELVRRALGARGLGDGLPPEESREARARDADLRVPRASIDLRGTEDRWEFAIDTTGPGLHKRGYRKAVAKAPLRETLAAAVLHATGWTGDRPLVDPMCGAGTLVIEGAWMVSGRDPGAGRRFAFESFPELDAARWTSLREGARTTVAGLPALEGSDRVGGAVKAARDNGRRAGLQSAVKWLRRPLEELPPKRGPGILITNPPYGKRAKADDAGRGSDRELNAWRRWGDLLRKARPDCDAWVVAPHPQLAEAAGARGRPALTFGHGGLTVALHRIG